MHPSLPPFGVMSAAGRSSHARDRLMQELPGRRVVHPAAADHRGDDLELAQLLRLARRTGRGRARRGRRGSRGSACRAGARRGRARPGRRTSREAPARPSAPPPAARPGRSSFERRTPATTPASGSSSSTGASEPFTSTRTRVEQRAERVGALEPVGPEALGEVAVGRARARTARSTRSRAAAKRGRSSAVRHCACSIRCRRPLRSQASRVASNASSAFRFAWSPIACTPTGQPALRAAADDLLELLARGDLDARPVGEQRRSRAERPVHEALQVADPEELVAEAGAERERRRAVEEVVRDRAPDPQREVPLVAQPLEDAGRAEPAVLVVDRRRRRASSRA